MTNHFHTTIRVIAQLLLTFAFVWISYTVLRPFVLPILTAGIIGIMARPMYEWLLKHNLGSTASAGITLAILIICCIIPLAILSNLVIKEISSATSWLQRPGNDLDSLDSSIQALLAHFGLTNVTVDVRSYLVGSLSDVAGKASTVLGGVLGILGDIVLVLFGVFYILQGIPRSRTYLHKISPLGESDTDMVISRIEEVIHATVKSNTIIMILQSLVFTLAGYVFGLQAPILIGLLYGITSLVPVIGTSVIWLPIAAFLAINGQIGSAIGLCTWALVQIGLIDHIIGPRIIGEQTRLNPFLTLIGILGGVYYFGLLGFIIGPTAMALGVVGLEMLGRSWETHEQATS